MKNTIPLPGAAAQDSERLAADRAWVRWGVAAAVTGMLACTPQPGTPGPGWPGWARASPG